MIRLLIIMTTTFDISGITNNVMNYYRYLDKSDMEIDFVAPNIVPNRLKDEISKNNGKVYELIMRNKSPIKYIFKLKKIILDGKYNIVHAHGNSSTLSIEMFAAKLAGVKIRIAHSHNTTSEHMITHKLLYPIFNATYTHGFACGNEAGKWLFRKKEFTVIKNGNDVDKFSFNPNIRNLYREKYNLNDKKVIGHVGSFSYQKNHEFLIDIFYELVKSSSNYVLILVGDGSLKSSIEKKVKMLGLEKLVIFTGKSLEVEKLIQAMDIMILPSRYEGFPNVVVEWQIAGLPCLISNKITREVQLTNLVNFMALEEGPKAWADWVNQLGEIDRLTNHKEAVKQIKEKGFCIKENAKYLKKIYLDLIKEVESK